MVEHLLAKENVESSNLFIRFLNFSFGFEQLIIKHWALKNYQIKDEKYLQAIFIALKNHQFLIPWNFKANFLVKTFTMSCHDINSLNFRN